MRKIYRALLVGGLLLGIVPGLSFAQTSGANAELKAIIDGLQQQVTELQSRINAIRSGAPVTRETLGEVRTAARAALQLVRQLERGMRGDDVATLQEILATDPELYPEALVTGFYGSLTENAVRRFQKKFGIEQAGRVGPKTLRTLNLALEDVTATSTATTTPGTAGGGLLRNVTLGNPSGKVPPGLLIAPGIQRKLGFAPQPLPGQALPPGIAKKLGQATSTPPGNGTSTPDVTPPVISDVAATSTATAATVSWLTNESSTSKVWYNTQTPVLSATGTQMVSDSSLVTIHSLVLSGLASSTVHYYVVESADATGNIATSSQASFTTLAQ